MVYQLPLYLEIACTFIYTVFHLKDGFVNGKASAENRYNRYRYLYL
jgi:transcriptional antiterminator Rof (Rho-off)